MIEVFPILQDRLKPEYIKQPFWMASVEKYKHNGKKYIIEEKGASPEIAVRRLLKLMNK